LLLLLLPIMIMMMVIQVDPRETDDWTKVEFVSDNIPIPASLVVVYVYADSSLGARISDLTADACIHPLRKYCFFFFSFLSVIIQIMLYLLM